MKISEWLTENIDSHTIYASDVMTEKFQIETGQRAIWPTHSPDQTTIAIELRGLGGTLYTSTPSENLSFGYEMAEALARKHAQYDGDSRFEGRGTRFRYAVECLEKAGF